jgi:hypothetical protein
LKRSRPLRNKTFAHLARRLLGRRALSEQPIDPTDSILGPYVDTTALPKGIRPSYSSLLRAAFNPNLWSARALASPTEGSPPSLTQMESIFSLFFGLAVHMYESTLVSDAATYDAFAD